MNSIIRFLTQYCQLDEFLTSTHIVSWFQWLVLLNWITDSLFLNRYLPYTRSVIRFSSFQKVLFLVFKETCSHFNTGILFSPVKGSQYEFNSIFPKPHPSSRTVESQLTWKHFLLGAVHTLLRWKDELSSYNWTILSALIQLTQSNTDMGETLTYNTTTVSVNYSSLFAALYNAWGLSNHP